MPKRAAKKLYRILEEELTNRQLLKKLNLSKKAMIDLLEEKGWRQIIFSLVSSEKITIKLIYEESRNTLDSLSEEPKEGWLEYCFNYTKNVLFPDNMEGLNPKNNYKYNRGRIFFSEVTSILLDYDEKRRNFSPILDMEVLSPEEIKNDPAKDEYEKYQIFFKKNYVKNFMRIGAEITPFNTWGHICGVHYVAMHVAKQLKEANVPIDLALVAGAAETHDIGKFGCKAAECNKIAYLHYYYTEKCLMRIGMPLITHIATNHSTWDLELENLPLESLVLIYADFRVKSFYRPDGREIVQFHTLDKSFDIILNKLDNVDEKKKARYIRVYEKLHDFEDYMKSRGVSVDLYNKKFKKAKWKDAALLSRKEAVERLKYLAIGHNIQVMNNFNSEASFGSLLESARSEKQWKNIRAYISTLHEYFTYMTQRQKEMTISFLSELLINREGDIRRQSAVLIGKIIANYDEEYRKELPEGTKNKVKTKDSYYLWRKHIENTIYPDLKSTEQQQRWKGYTLKVTQDSIIHSVPMEEARKYLDIFLRIIKSPKFDKSSVFVALDTAMSVPSKFYSEKAMNTLFDFASKAFKMKSVEVKVAALRFIKYIVTEKPISQLSKVQIKKIESITNTRVESEESVSIIYLKHKILAALGNEPKKSDRYEKMIYTGDEVASTIFRENLKVGTPWVIKAVNIELLLDGIKHGKEGEIFYFASHLSNLLKVSERVTVRHIAGRGLIEVFNYLSYDQRNEIVVELTKGLEIGEYQFSKYIPQYLGPLALKLHPDELDEVIYNLGKLLESSNDKVVSVTLNTLGEILRQYPKYNRYSKEDKAIYLKRNKTIIGMILRGMANYHPVVSQEAFMVLGQYIFGSPTLTLKEKFAIFKLMHKKMLTLIVMKKEDSLTFFYNAAALNHIYRFIADYNFYEGDMRLPENKKVAFFPGTFDPFSLSHKGIVNSIRELGFEVYLALDEFSWSKKTQPRMIRRQIMAMSTASQTGVYIFPDDAPINIANNRDIREIKKLLQGKNPYIVVGSDVVANASSYKMAPEKNSVQSLNHIIFKRDSLEQGKKALGKAYSEALTLIKGNVIELTLPTQLEDISSTRIRENIDNNRDISSLIDPVVQNYIYDNSLYMREPQYKDIMTTRALKFSFTKDGEDIKTMTIRDGNNGNKIIASASVSHGDTAKLYEEFLDQDIAVYIRKNALGKILIIRSIVADPDFQVENPYQLVLTEALAEALKEDYAYAIYHPKKEDTHDIKAKKVLKRQGFSDIEIDGQSTGILAVNMKNPVTILQNMDMVLKDPFNKNPRIKTAVRHAHEKLQASLVRMYSNTLILSLSSSVMHNRLIDKITAVNGVPKEPRKKRKLGPYMCVPFGKILNNMAVPNTVTKTLHTEKSFTPTLDSFIIKEYPFYSSISNQIKTIRSFDRGVILVDDLLHKGYRMKSLDVIFKENNINVECLMVGMLSGRGKDLSDIMNRKVDCVYFIPNLSTWFVESSLYPFIGGDGVERPNSPIEKGIRSINLIMPYVSPKFLANAGEDAVYDFSMVCLENARDTFKVIEEEYQNTFQRKLTLQRLSEAILSPKRPDVGEFLTYDKNLAPSAYLQSDIEKLFRLKGMVK